MFTKLDDLLFPNRVEVLNFHEINKHFYPIFKCGSSTLRVIAEDRGFETLVNNQIKNLNEVDVFIRNPVERYISGVQSYLYHNSELDVDTVKHFLKQGIILDRHFAHQFQWIINLSRYLSPTARVNIHSMAMINEYCKNIKIEAWKNDTINLNDVVTSPELKLAFSLDQIILDELVGDSWTIAEIFQHLKERNSTAYSAIIGKAQNVLSKI